MEVAVLTETGLDIMDSYNFDGFCFWYHLPLGNGPGGMYSYSRPSPSLLALTCWSIDYSLTMARPPPNRRNDYCRPGLFPRARAQRSSIREERPRPVCDYPDAHVDDAGRVGYLSEAAFVQGN